MQENSKPTDHAEGRTPFPALLARHRVFLAALLLLIGRYAFLPPLFQNEADALPLARQALDPGWLPGDWYLNQPPGYRAAFDYTVSWLVTGLSFQTGAVLGRLLTLVLFAWALQELARALGLGARWVVLGLLGFLFLFEQSLIAGEWMVGGLEAKPFAYVAVLLALAALLRGRLVLAFFLFGLAVSWHVLVGLYATLTAAGLLLLHRRPLAGDLRRLLLAALCFLPAAALGLWAVGQHLLEPGGEGARLATRIYVHGRVPWHLLPSFWLTQSRLPLALKLTGFAACVAGLTFVARRHPDEQHRLLARYALLSLVFFAVGLVWAALGKDGMLTLYWFRFPDTIVPFTACLLVPNALGIALARGRAGRLASGAVLLVGLGALVWAGVMTAVGATRLFGGGPEQTWGLEPGRAEVQFWIREHAPPGAVFFIDPFWKEFYILAQRPVFVTFKHFPQTQERIIEWYHRIAGPNADPWDFPASRDVRDDYQERFRKLTAADIRSLAAAYHFTHAILPADHDPFARDGARPREVYRNEGYVVYDLRAGRALLLQDQPVPAR